MAPYLRIVSQSDTSYHLIFTPILTMEEQLQAFDVYLGTGDRHASVVYKITYRSGWYEEGVLDGAPESLLRIHRLGFDTLNESPVYTFFMELAEPETGLEVAWEIEVKLKPSSFFKKEREFPGFEDKVYVYPLGTWPKEKMATAEDWKKLGKRVQSRQPGKRHTVQEKANLKHDIDLHAEALGVNLKDLSPGEILELQIRTCERYLNKAIMHGLYQVYLIHGVGTGKLRSAIHELLEHYPQVQSYRNEYHPKYGLGATEVSIR